MKIPRRCKIGQEGLVYKILMSLYGLKQVGKLWNKILIKFSRTIGFVTTNADPYIPTYQKDNIFIIVGMYIDDLALASQSQEGLNWFNDQLIYEFNIKDLSEAKTIIGWEISRDFQVGTLKIDQKAYIRDFLESEGMSSCHPTVFLMKAG